MKIVQSICRIALVAAVAGLAVFSVAPAVNAQAPPDIRINNYLKPGQVQRGRTVQGVVEMEIPQSYHVHSNRPLEKFLIATQLQMDAPTGVKVGPVSYPRALIKNLRFSKNKVAVYEGKVAMRFNVTVPASFSGDSIDMRGKLRYQSCSDDVCFPPQTRDVTFSIKVVK